MHNVLRKVAIGLANTLFHQDVLKTIYFLQGLLAALNLWEEGFGEYGSRIVDNVNESNLACMRGEVPILFMISQALSRGITRL